MLGHNHKEQEEVRDPSTMPLVDTRNVAQTHGLLGQTVRNIVYQDKEYQERYPFIDGDVIALLCL
jgi:hypothetical protein